MDLTGLKAGIDPGVDQWPGTRLDTASAGAFVIMDDTLTLLGPKKFDERLFRVMGLAPVQAAAVLDTQDLWFTPCRPLRRRVNHPS